ncbi:MAG: Trm112 family protein [Chloroflexota bacterium]
MVDAALVAIMVCPESHQPLSVADEATVQKLNAAIGAGTLKNRDGETVTEAIEGGLVREDGAYLYVVRDSIPVMLIGEAIPLAGV